MIDEYDLAFTVVDKVVPQSEPQAMRTSMIPIILQILAALAPMLLECIEGDDSAQKVQRLCDCYGIRRRLRVLMLMRVIRREVGPDASVKLVRTIANQMMELGTDLSYANAYAKNYLV